MNPINDTQIYGKYGELYVQMELLKCGIESFSPMIDTGNDLIAVNNLKSSENRIFKTVQVKTTQSGEKWNLSKLAKYWDLLALVAIEPQNKSEIIVITKPICIWLIPNKNFHEKDKQSISIRKVKDQYNEFELVYNDKNIVKKVRMLFK